jgi:putative IMPACT (imprinted ancient) family translation regulator
MRVTIQEDCSISSKLNERKHTITHCEYHSAVHNCWYTVCDSNNSGIFEFCSDRFLKDSISCVVYRCRGLIEN